MLKKLALLFISLIPAAFCENLFAQNTTQSSAAKLKQERTITGDVGVAVGGNFRNITIDGWDSDKIEAAATDSLNQKPVPILLTESQSSGKRVLLVSLTGNDRNSVITLEMKVPRGIKLETLQIGKGSLRVSNIEGSVTAKTNEGIVNINNVGAVSVETLNNLASAADAQKYYDTKSQKGTVNLENVKGRVEITAFDSVILVRNVAGDVQITSVSSPKLDVRCVKGRVEISDTSSLIALADIEDDVEVTTSTGVANFTGQIYSGKLYRLKTLTGRLLMSLPEASNFTALIKTYSGAIGSAFVLESDKTLGASGNLNKQLAGKYGDGSARIELDSFSGVARLRKSDPAAPIKNCEP